MPKSSIPAAGEAMSAEGHSDTLDIADDISEVHDLVEAAYMAAETLSREKSGPLCTVLNIAEQKLRAVRDKLTDGDMPAPDDPTFAALAAFKAAHEAYRQGPKTDNESTPLFEARDRALRALGKIKPTTAEGAAAVISAILEQESDFVDQGSPLLGAMRNVAAFLSEID